MVRSERTYVPADNAVTETTAKYLTKQQFAKRLYQLMLGKGWRQSELARRASLPRDSVSVYIRGKSLPTSRNLQKLAQALGVTTEELLPNYTEHAMDEDHPAFEMRVSSSRPNKAWLRINRLVSLSTATTIAKLLESDTETNGDAADRS